MSEPIRMDGQYQTRDGKYRYRVICVDAKGSQPVAALWEDAYGVEYVRRFNADGIYDTTGRQSPHDLVPVPKNHKCWVNMYKNDTWCAYGSRELADAHAIASSRIACKEVEFTEGEGLSPATEE